MYRGISTSVVILPASNYPVNINSVNNSELICNLCKYAICICNNQCTAALVDVKHCQCFNCVVTPLPGSDPKDVNSYPGNKLNSICADNSASCGTKLLCAHSQNSSENIVFNTDISHIPNLNTNSSPNSQHTPPDNTSSVISSNAIGRESTSNMDGIHIPLINNQPLNSSLNHDISSETCLENSSTNFVTNPM